MTLNISFIIPTYNAEYHLNKCLSSIRSQDYPQEAIEIIIADGGSHDSTIEIARQYSCIILNNFKRLAEYGVQLGIQKASGEISVIFAADNELVGYNWIKKVGNIFAADKEITAVWGRLVSGKDDTALNKYFELIQSDPLNWFLNKNLDKYKKNMRIKGTDIFSFRVDQYKPLVWGANGLAYRSEIIKGIWAQEGYLGDNDAFQCMIEQGKNKVAYFDHPFVYHHHVANLGDWVKKWRRNFSQHLLSKQKTRNMNWVFAGSFKIKLFFWVLYSAIPVISLTHSIYLSIKDKNIYWLYHPAANFLQLFTYCSLIFFDKKGINFVKGIVGNNG